jgi:hypothetical protein
MNLTNKILLGWKIPEPHKIHIQKSVTAKVQKKRTLSVSLKSGFIKIKLRIE